MKKFNFEFRYYIYLNVSAEKNWNPASTLYAVNIITIKEKNLKIQRTTNSYYKMKRTICYLQKITVFKAKTLHLFKWLIGIILNCQIAKEEVDKEADRLYSKKVRDRGLLTNKYFKEKMLRNRFKLWNQTRRCL